MLEDLGLKSDAIRTVRDSAELSPRRSSMRRRPPADWELKASTRSDGDFGATLAEALKLAMGKTGWRITHLACIHAHTYEKNSTDQ